MVTTRLCPAARIGIALGFSAVASLSHADFSDDPLNPTPVDVQRGLWLLEVELGGTNLADWVRFEIEKLDKLCAIFNFESMFFHGEPVTMRLDRILEIVPGVETFVSIGEIEIDQNTDPTGDLLLQLGHSALFGGDYRLGWTQTTAETSDMRFVFRTTPAPGGIALLAGLPMISRRRR